MIPDSALLRQYAETGDEAAFAAVVQRYLPMIYGAALRLMGGDSHLAEDVAQGVFTDLARKARVLSGHQTLAGWLHTSARYRAGKILRTELRRQRREQEAATMQEINSAPDMKLEQLRPVLDEAVGRLPEGDRNAVLLRFFQGKSYAEAAAILGLSENTVNKRVERALDKLRLYFAQRGVVTTAALLGSLLGANAAMPPAGLAVKVTDASLARAAAASGFAQILGRRFFSPAQFKMVGLAVVIAVSGVVLLVLQVRQNSTAKISATGISAPTPSLPETKARIAAPTLPPLSTEAALSKEAEKNLWVVDSYIPSVVWHDVGADTPENALETYLWALNAGDTDRAFDVSKVALLPEDSPDASDPDVGNPPYVLSGPGMKISIKANGEPDYEQRLGAKIVARKEISPEIIRFSVATKWKYPVPDQDEQPEEFEFHHDKDGWKLMFRLHPFPADSYSSPLQ